MVLRLIERILNRNIVDTPTTTMIIENKIIIIVKLSSSGGV